MNGKPMDYDAMTMDALQAEFVRLAKLLVPIEAERRAIEVVMKRRKAEVSATVRLRSLSEPQRDALAAVLRERK